MSKKKKTISRPHLVDDESATVYISASGWSNALAAPHLVHDVYPGYKCMLVSEEYLTKEINDRIKRNEAE
jgi:hypothetical protein